MDHVLVGRSVEVPKSVHQLRPGDIDVIGAMGDSLTAGIGIFATSLLHLAIENRGVVASGGGQGTWREFLTLPNILKVWIIRDYYSLSMQRHFFIGKFRFYYRLFDCVCGACIAFCSLNEISIFHFTCLLMHRFPVETRKSVEI